MKNTVHKEIKKLVLKESGFKTIASIKKHLKLIATNPYGCYIAEYVNKEKGFSIVYTSNPNCWATYILKMNAVGMIKTLALDRKSITKAGRQRGSGDYYLNA